MVVTGCDTGSGQGMALGLVQAGCDTVDINIAEPTGTIKQVAALGRRFSNPTANLWKINGISVLLDRAVAEFGYIDILMNNTGLTCREDALGFSKKDWDDIMNLSIRSVFFILQAMTEHFIAQGNGGKTTNIVPMLSSQGGIHVPSYAALKSGMVSVARLMMNERAKHNINVNAVAPGYMATNNTQQLRADEQRSAEILDRIPAGRWGLPSDLIRPIVFLASNASGYVNGYTITVDGDWLVR